MRGEKALEILLKSCMAGMLLVVFYTMLVCFILPPVIKHVASNKLAESLHRKLTIQTLVVDPYALSVMVFGAVVKNPDNEETFASVDRIRLEIDVHSLFSKGLIVKGLVIEKPVLDLVLRGDGTSNFSDLVEPKRPAEEGKGRKPEKAQEQERGSGGGLLKFSINGLLLSDGEIRVDDGPRNERHVLKNICLRVPLVSNMGGGSETEVHPILSTDVDDMLVELQGAVRPFSDTLETELSLNIDGADLSRYLAYIPADVPLDLLSGVADADLCLSFRKDERQGKSFAVEADLALREVELLNRRDGRIMRVSDLEVSHLVYDFSTKRLSVAKALLKSPQIHVTRDAAGKLQLLSPPSKAAAAEAEEEADDEGEGEEEEREEPVDGNPSEGDSRGYSGRMTISVDELGVEEGKISFEDRSQGTSFQTVLEPVNFDLTGFSTDPAADKAGFSLDLLTEAEESVKLEGELSLKPLAVEGSLELADIAVEKYAPFYAAGIPFRMQGGKVALQTRFNCSWQESRPRLVLSGLSAAVSDVKLTKKTNDRKELLSVGKVAVKDATVDLSKREISIHRLETSAGSLAVVRSKEGAIDLQDFFTAPVAPAAPARAGEGLRPIRSGKNELPWHVSVENITAGNYTIQIRDESLAEPATHTISGLDLAVSHFSLPPASSSQVSLSLALNGKGTISMKGELGLSPPAANLDLNLSHVDLAPFRGYIPPGIDVGLNRGDLGLAGKLTCTRAEAQGVVVKYQGKASLSELEVFDRRNGAQLVACKLLDMDSVSAGYNPTFLNVNEIALSGFSANIVRGPDMKINLLTLAHEESPPSGAQPVPAKGAGGSRESAASKEDGQQVKQLKIERIVFKGGSIRFTDTSVHPTYQTSLDGIQGAISHFVLGEIKPADVALTGKQNNYSPLRIEGKILPFRQNLLVDIQLKFEDVDMVQMNSYLKKILGHNVQKGKASLDLRYLIDKNKLDSRNILVIDNLTLGSQTKTPGAIDLPIRPAIAILKNRDGAIQLDIPVQGDLDDPKFSIKKVVWDFLYNLIKKIIISPFTFLGMPFGAGEELRYLEFDYGGSDLEPATVKKLDILAEAIQGKPKLAIELEGHVDVEKDRQGLAKKLFRLKLQEQKFKEQVAKGLPAAPVEETVISSEEYNRYLEKAYKEEKFPKPKNLLGLDKSLSASEMEALMLRHITVEDEDLKLLALKRAVVLRDYLVNTRRVDHERIFLVEPESLAPEKNKDLKDSRVDVKLK